MTPPSQTLLQPDYQVLFESAPGLYLVLKPDFTIAAASDAYLRATMTSRANIIGRDIFAVFPDNPDNPAATGVSNLRLSLERVLKNKVPDAMAVQKYDIRRPASEGGGFEERFWSPLNSPVFGAAQEVIYIIHRVEDVTDLSQRSEEALRLSEERYRQLFELNPHPMWVYDLQTWAFLAVNEAAIENYGYSRDEFLAMTIQEIRPSVDRTAVSDNRTNAFRRFETSGNSRHKRKNGTIIDVEVTSHELSFEGRAARLVSAADVTEKKNIEAQLLRAQRMESIGTLAGGIAHDLNNVLAPILMAIQLLTDRFPDESSRRTLEGLETSAKRGASIVRQLLTFARGAEGERIPIQLKTVLSGMEKMLAETFPKCIRIQADVPKNLWLVVGDATQLQQVVLNLCVNSRDAMPDGGVLKIVAENTILDEQYARLNLEAKAGLYVVIEVADTGCGMPAGLIDKVFEPFFTTKEVGKGTGLGLSTVRAIVKSHDGFVNVYSEVGRGTRVKVFLPAKEYAETHEVRVLQGKLPLGRGQQLLVVDDESAVLDITKVTLESYGYRVVTARDGAAALAVYARQGVEIEAVLLDMMMPVLDGPATIRALEALNPNVKIIAASGLIDSAKNAGVSFETSTTVRAVLTKPYTAERLLKTLHDVLRPA